MTALPALPAKDKHGFALPGGGAPAVITPAPPPPPHPLLEELACVIDRLADLDPAERSDDGLTVDLQEVEIQLRRLGAWGGRMLEAFDWRGVAPKVLGLPSTRAFLRTSLRGGHHAIGRRLTAVRAAFGEHGDSVEARARRLPETEAAWSRGDLDEAHVQLIAETHRRLVRDLVAENVPDEELLERSAEAEQVMVAAALMLDPERLRKQTAHIRDQFVPEAVPEREARMWQRRSLRLEPLLNGFQRLTGTLMPEAAQLLKRAMAPYELSRGSEDDRFPTQVAHDALAELALASLDATTDNPSAAASGQLGAPADSPAPPSFEAEAGSEAQEPEAAPCADDAGGSAAASADDAHAPGPHASLLHSLAHLEVVVSLSMLSDLAALGRGETAKFLDGTFLDRATALKLICGSDLARVVMNAGCIVEQSKSRSAEGNLRRRILLRDRCHCQFPGCDRPARHIHHLQFHSQGGPTASWNLVSLCYFHHNLIHYEGWTLSGNPDVNELVAVAPDRYSLPQRVRKMEFGTGTGWHERQDQQRDKQWAEETRKRWADPP